MSTAKSNKSNNNEYFNIMLEGVGYVNDVTGRKGSNGIFVTVNIAALQGKKDDVQFTRFSCIAVTDSAKDVLRTIKNDHPEASVFAKFKLSGLDSESFTYPQTSKRAGEMGVNLKSRLMDLKILTVDGERLADQTESSKDNSSTKEEHEIQEALAAPIDEQNSDPSANKIDEEDDIVF